MFTAVVLLVSAMAMCVYVSLTAARNASLIRGLYSEAVLAAFLLIGPLAILFLGYAIAILLWG